MPNEGRGMVMTQSQQEILDQLLPLMMQAVPHAENSKKYPNGIKSIKTKNPDKALEQSIRNNYIRWATGQQPAPWIKERPAKFVDFMRRRFAPLKSEGATDDPNNLNVNWAPNVRDKLRNMMTPEQYLRMQQLNLVQNQGAYSAV